MCGTQYLIICDYYCYYYYYNYYGTTSQNRALVSISFLHHLSLSNAALQHFIIPNFFPSSENPFYHVFLGRPLGLFPINLSCSAFLRFYASPSYLYSPPYIITRVEIVGACGVYCYPLNFWSLEGTVRPYRNSLIVALQFLFPNQLGVKSIGTITIYYLWWVM